MSQFVVDGRQLLSIGDDTFGPSGGDGDGLRGRDALMVELERSRSGEMLDIVATIQPEQDEVIRSDPDGVLAVQGGPGSGKTAIGLHRAAFLLYGDEAMARANVLVVGPNRTFLRYIAAVLPSLGEHSVVQTTLVSLVPEVDGGRRGADSPEAERVKGDGRMATVLSRALAARRGHDQRDLEVAMGVRRLRVEAAEVDSRADRVAALDLPYASGREVLRSRLVLRLAARFEELAGRLLPEAAPDVKPTEAARPGRSTPRLVRPAGGDIGAAVAAEAAGLLREWATVAVITPAAMTGAVLDRLRSELGTSRSVSPTWTGLAGR